jgi:hypothetical protein
MNCSKQDPSSVAVMLSIMKHLYPILSARVSVGWQSLMNISHLVETVLMAYLSTTAAFAAILENSKVGREVFSSVANDNVRVRAINLCTPHLNEFITHRVFQESWNIQIYDT